MKTLTFLLKTLTLLLISLPLIIVIMLIDQTPLIDNSNQLSAPELDTVQQLLIDNDPRQLINGNEQNIYLTENEANILLRYFFSQTPQLSDYRSQVTFSDSQAKLILSLPINSNPFGEVINLQISIGEAEQALRVVTLQAGSLELPEALLTPTLDYLNGKFEQTPNYQLFQTLLNTIDTINFQDSQTAIHIQWNQEEISQVRETARDLLIAPSQQSRVSIYYEQLIALETATFEQGNQTISLNLAFQSLFQFAYDSVLSGYDPVLENRAIFLALSIYLTDLSLDQVSGETNETLNQHRPRMNIELNGRIDLARHAVTSAAISSTSSSSIMELISVYKEVQDSRSRSGFSFDDITANQAGASLGSIASETQSIAHRLQFVMKDNHTESSWMPDIITGISISEQEFTQQFGGRDTEAYLEKLDEIEDAISSLPVFQAFESPDAADDL